MQQRGWNGKWTQSFCSTQMLIWFIFGSGPSSLSRALKTASFRFTGRKMKPKKGSDLRSYSSYTTFSYPSRRLLYVACTRAQSMLCLTHALSRKSGGQIPTIAWLFTRNDDRLQILCCAGVPRENELCPFIKDVLSGTVVRFRYASILRDNVLTYIWNLGGPFIRHSTNSTH